MSEYLTAAEVTQILGIKPATLYSYVSRRLIRSEIGTASTRERVYSAKDVYFLYSKRSRKIEKTKIPFYRTDVSENFFGDTYYRDQRVIDLAEKESVEYVTGLLWNMNYDHLYISNFGNMHYFGSDFVKNVCHILIDKNKEYHSIDKAKNLLGLLYSILEKTKKIKHSKNLPMHKRLAAAWEKPDYDDLLRRALILLAENDSGVSSSVAHSVSASGAGMSSAVLSAICSSDLRPVEASCQMLDNAMRSGANYAVRGASYSGNFFGFSSYSDKRAYFLLATAAKINHPVISKAYEIIDVLKNERNIHPSLDFALAVLVIALGKNAAEARDLFVLSRSIGWIAHAIEAERERDGNFYGCL